MISKATRRKLETVWKNQCAICGNKDFLEVHHITPKTSGGTDDYDNLILLCACCHSAIHHRAYNAATYRQIGESLNCSVSTVERAIKTICNLSFGDMVFKKNVIKEKMENDFTITLGTEINFLM